MNRIFSLAPAAAAASLLALTGCRSTAPQTPPSRFAQADKNKDCKLSVDEANEFIVIGLFESLDRNKDGKLVLAECAVEGAPVTVTKFRRRDTNKDGSITKDEALQYGRTKGIASKAFPKADKNQDGALSTAEVTEFYGDKEGSPF